jgi:hypothetical protein
VVFFYHKWRNRGLSYPKGAIKSITFLHSSLFFILPSQITHQFGGSRCAIGGQQLDNLPIPSLNVCSFWAWVFRGDWNSFSSWTRQAKKCMKITFILGTWWWRIGNMFSYCKWWGLELICTMMRRILSCWVESFRNFAYILCSTYVYVFSTYIHVLAIS